MRMVEVPLKRIRVLLGDMPTMLRDIVTDVVANEPDLEVSGVLGPRESLQAGLKRVQADVLVVGNRRPDLGTAEEIWREWPLVKILMIATDARSAVLYALRPIEIVLGDISPEGLAAALRGAHASAERPRPPHA
jgi:DNA-binding NarL/FixJ family response regulator